MSLKNKQKTLSVLLTIVLLLTTSLPGHTATECTPIVVACDKALADKEVVIDLKTRQITAYKEVVAAQDTRIAALEKEKGGLFSSPWFYFGIGIVAGALIVRGR